MATILIVDDEPDVRVLLEESLKLAGHDVVTACDGEDALAKLKRRRYDLMVLDIMMPRLDGYSVLEQVRAMPSRADIPVIVVTAKHDPDGVMREFEFGAVDHIVKPFHPVELEQAVERALNAPEAAEHRRHSVASDAEVYSSMGMLFREAQSQVVG